MTRSIPLFITLILIATVGYAEDVCPLDITPGECILRHGARVGSNVAQEQINKTPTSVDPLGSEIASTLRDFLPLFDGLINIDSISEDGQTVNLNLNPAINFKPLQLTASIRKPVVWEVLEKSLPEEQREELVEKLDSSLSDYDDIEVTATYRLTRSKSREAFRYDNVFQKLVSTVAVPDLDDLDTLLQSVENTPAFANLTIEPKLELYKATMPPEDWRRLQPLLSGSAEAITKYEQAVETMLSDSFEAFAKAVNNQSQLFASLSYRQRDDIVGPDVLSLKVTYEIGLSGIKSLQRALKLLDGAESCQLNIQLEELATACDGAALAQGIRTWGENANDNRISFSLEYSDFDNVTVALPGIGVDFEAESQKSLVASAAWGRRLGPKERSPRIDFQASYEDVSDNPNRRDRGVASLVLSQKITDNWTLPIGVLYANHTRYLTGEDERLSAHIGVRYKLQEKQLGN